MKALRKQNHKWVKLKGGGKAGRWGACWHKVFHFGLSDFLALKGL